MSGQLKEKNITAMECCESEDEDDCSDVEMEDEGQGTSQKDRQMMISDVFGRCGEHPASPCRICRIG